MSEEKKVARKFLGNYKGFAVLDGKLFSGVCVDYYDNGQKNMRESLSMEEERVFLSNGIKGGPLLGGSRTAKKDCVRFVPI